MDVKQLKKIIDNKVQEGVKKELEKIIPQIKKQIVDQISKSFQTVLSEGLSDIVSKEFSIRLIPKNKLIESQEYGYSQQQKEYEDYTPEPIFRKQISVNDLDFKNPMLKTAFSGVTPFGGQEELGLSMNSTDNSPLSDNRNTETGAPLNYSNISPSLVETLQKDFRPIMRRLNQVDYRKKVGGIQPMSNKVIVGQEWHQ